MTREIQWHGDNASEMQAFCGDQWANKPYPMLLVPDIGAYNGVSRRALAIGDYVVTLRDGSLTNSPQIVHDQIARNEELI